MEIPDLYRERSILVTGVTGFLGKVLLEKILRCCPGIARVFVLIRSKKGKSPEERLAATLSSPLFDRVRKEQPRFDEVVTIVTGDVMLPQLGVDSDELNPVIQEVSIVFHCAASVKFNEPMQNALESNVGGVDKIIWLTKQMKKIEALVHLSTAYAYCNRKHIEEVVYPLNANPYELLQSVRWMSKDMIEAITPFLLFDYPNSYTYTKAMAENLLVSYQQSCSKESKFPIAIVRPSVVLSSWKEPMAGWIDSSNGPVGLVITYGKGLLRTMIGKREAEANYIPVDFATNLMIAAAWRCVSLRQITSDASTLTVYNCTNDSSNPITWGTFSDCTIENVWKYPIENSLRVPVRNHTIAPNFYKNRIEWLYNHLIPAAFGDLVLSILRKKPRLLKWYKSIFSTCKCLEYFTMRSWKWDQENVMQLRSSMSKKDRKIFYFDTCDIQWKKYLEEYHVGIKKYILQEDLETIQETKAMLRRRKAIEDFVILCFFLIGLLMVRGSVPALFVQISSTALIFNYVFQLFSWC